MQTVRQPTNIDLSHPVRERPRNIHEACLLTSERSRLVLARGRSRPMVLEGRRLRSILPRPLPPDLRGRRTRRSQRVGADPGGALAVILLLDQFPRNMFRATRPVQDRSGRPHGRRPCHRARLRPSGRPPAPGFFYLPFMHSENLAVTRRSVRLERSPRRPGIDKWAHHHRDIVANFRPLPPSQCHPRPRMRRRTKRRFWRKDDFRG